MCLTDHAGIYLLQQFSIIRIYKNTFVDYVRLLHIAAIPYVGDDKMMNDWQLLQQYNKGSEAAFETIIQKYNKMVYWTCHRDLHNPQLAEDATQTVFILLARKAASMHSHTSISGWLFKSARLVSKDIIRSEQRRKRQEERIACEMETQIQNNMAWGEIEPLLNDGISSLGDADRNSILMRYFNELSHKEIAGILGCNEDAARMRVHRAISKLRSYLIKRGVQVTPVVLGLLLSDNAVRDTPGLSVPALTHAVGQSYTLQSAGLLSSCLLKGATIIMELSKQKAAVTLISVLLVGAVGTGVYKLRVNSAHWKTSSVLIDHTPPGLANIEDKKLILAEYRKQSDAFATRSVYQGNANPNYTVTMSDGKVLKVGQVLDQLNTFYTILGDYNCSFTITAMQINSDKATVDYTMHIDGKFDNIRRPYIPAGTHILVNQIQQDHWIKVDGKWRTQNSLISNSQILVNGKPVKV